MSELNSKLDGFVFVESDYLPFISLDKIGRFHVNKNARRLLGVKAFDKVVLAYHGGNNELAVLPESYANEVPGAAYSRYVIDGRHYMSAKALAKEYGLLGSHHVFYYDRSTTDGSLFIFKKRDNLPE